MELVAGAWEGSREVSVLSCMCGVKYDSKGLNQGSSKGSWKCVIRGLDKWIW